MSEEKKMTPGEFLKAVDELTKKMLDKATVEYIFGIGEPASRISEAKAVILLRHKDHIDQLSAIVEKLSKQISEDKMAIINSHEGCTFMDCVGGLDAAIKTLHVGNRIDGSLVACQLLDKAGMMDCLSKMKWRNYVYGLCLEDGRVFYIGKGVESRIFMHEKEALSGGTSEKHHVINSLGDKLRYTIFLSCADDGFAAGFEASMLLANKDLIKNIAKGSPLLMEKMFHPAFDDDALGVNKIGTMKAFLKSMLESNAMDMRRLIRNDSSAVRALSFADVDWYGSHGITSK